MPIRIPLVTENFYHIYNRGVEKRTFFLDEKDYFYFIHCLYEFNDTLPALDPRVARAIQRSALRREREIIVDIVAWCLMPNHFHLLLHQRVDKGITLFMRKLGVGYAMYFNKKYEHSGVLFQGRFKSILVDRDEYLLHLMRYIHLNPVDLIEPGWGERGINDWTRANQFLESYRWSSYLDWIGKKNFPSLLGQTVVQEMFSGGNDHKKFVQEWLSKDRGSISHLLFE